VDQIRTEAWTLLDCTNGKKLNGKASYGEGLQLHDLCIGGEEDDGEGEPLSSVCNDLLTDGQNASATSTHYLCIDLVPRSEQKYTVNKRVTQFELL
jgi:hypothetical protein